MPLTSRVPDVPPPGRRNAAERILRGAAECLVLKGAAELSMQDVADTAGVSKALIHYHYRDKEALLEQVALWATTKSEEHTSELQSQSNLVCRLLLEKKKKKTQRDS